MTGPRPALADLRDQLLELVELTDLAEPPAPDRVHKVGDLRGAREQYVHHPGAEWRPAKDWIVRTIEDGDGGPPDIFIETPHSHGGDLVAITTRNARRVAAAILAACQRAEQRKPNGGNTDG